MTTFERRPHTRRRAPCTVLIVDDHDESRITQRLVLEHFGFCVSEAQNGLDGLAVALASQPNIVLIDVIMPEVDGCELARMLRADPTTRPSALVAISAMADPETRDRALRAGCDEFITKPVPPLQLVRVVQGYARRRATRTYDFDPMETGGLRGL
jgi:CheY-like chemotaxis protein